MEMTAAMIEARLDEYETYLAEEDERNALIDAELDRINQAETSDDGDDIEEPPGWLPEWDR